jgi:hypothetical protein
MALPIFALISTVQSAVEAEGLVARINPISRRSRGRCFSDFTGALRARISSAQNEIDSQNTLLCNPNVISMSSKRAPLLRKVREKLDVRLFKKKITIPLYKKMLASIELANCGAGDSTSVLINQITGLMMRQVRQMKGANR